MIASKSIESAEPNGTNIYEKLPQLGNWELLGESRRMANHRFSTVSEELWCISQILQDWAVLAGVDGCNFSQGCNWSRTLLLPRTWIFLVPGPRLCLLRLYFNCRGNWNWRHFKHTGKPHTNIHSSLSGKPKWQFVAPLLRRVKIKQLRDDFCKVQPVNSNYRIKHRQYIYRRTSQ